MVKKPTVKKVNKKNLDDELRVRLEEKELTKFKSKSETVANKPYQIFIREIITAFNEDRLRIIKAADQKSSALYVTR